MSRLQLDNPNSWNTIELSSSASVSPALHSQDDDFGQHLERAQNTWNQPAANASSDNGSSARVSDATASLASPPESAPSQSTETANEPSGNGSPMAETSSSSPDDSSKPDDGKPSPSSTKSDAAGKPAGADKTSRNKHSNDASDTTGNPTPVPIAATTAAPAARLPPAPSGHQGAANDKNAANKPKEDALEAAGKGKTPPSSIDPSVSQPSDGATSGSQGNNSAATPPSGLNEEVSGTPGERAPKKTPPGSLPSVDDGSAEPSSTDPSAETASPGSLPTSGSSPTVTDGENSPSPDSAARTLQGDEPGATPAHASQYDPSNGLAGPIEPTESETQLGQPAAAADPKGAVADTPPATTTRRTTDDDGRSISSPNDAGSDGAAGAKPAAGTGVTQSSSADPSQNGSGADHVDQAQLIQRIAHAFQTAVERGGSSIRLQLSPPELGSLRVELTLRNGAMSARMETETDAARTVLQDNLPALRERLAEHNIRVERFDVDLSGQSSGNSSGRSGNSSSRYDPSGGQSVPASSRVPSTAVASPTPTPAARPGTRSHIDVVV